MSLGFDGALYSGKWNEALAILTRADSLLPGHGDISLHLAEAQWQTGDTDAARATLRHFLDASDDKELRANAESLLRKLDE